MGVPKFFRYTSERYPCLNELVKQSQIPEFDNMYLDMNGIIHNCSHPDDSNPHFRITEQKIFEDIFHYISILFQIIKPKKLFFMAIDGVAPRAKMNQQRGRRFRSAREAEKLEQHARDKGETLPTEKRFDSNCITPGTVFMHRLHEQLKYFVKNKISTDPLWAKVVVILSGHETPGEGEHKIMDYIRWMRSQPDYNPNTRHCLYGLDADLIMLGMCTHEPHFALLREEVKFGKTTQRATSPEETNFYLLHLSLLREYLAQEFINIKDKLPFEYDIEKIVDDWVLMGFLVGNDFIPNLPHMHISNDALPLLYKTYMTVLPTLDGYINEAGDLHLERFETFMQELAKIDKEKFQDTYADLKYFEAKTGRRPNSKERKEYKPNDDETFNVNIDDIKGNKLDDGLEALIKGTNEMFLEEDAENVDDFEETSDEEANFEMEFITHKKDYYMNKLDYSKVTEEVLMDQAECYVRAIQWNLYYYYKGCPSWCWYYPHHYAPYISDIKGFKDLKIEFELGEPFKPFEQLLAVLPASSKHLLPTPFHDLMTKEDSPIVHYYPENFQTDLNGKVNDWEAVVLIPFIDETNLLSAMAPCYQRLTEEELKRNSHGPMLVYSWSAESQGPAIAPEYFSIIEDCHAKEIPVMREQLDVPLDKLKRGMLPNTQRNMIFPGFPTMRHLKYRSYIEKAKVKVFNMPSRNDTMIIELIKDEKKDLPIEEVAKDLLGRIVWVGWPHLAKAKVISVSNEEIRYHHSDRKNANGEVCYTTEPNSGNLHKQWQHEQNTVIEHNKNRLGIELGDVNIIIHAVNIQGYKYTVQDNARMVLEPEFYPRPCGYAFQAVLDNVKSVVQEVGKYSTPEEAYPPGDHVFLLTRGQYYGCSALIVEKLVLTSGRIKVQVIDVPEPTPVIYPVSTTYKSCNNAAASCGISPQMLSRITGCLLVVAGPRNNLPTERMDKLNIGLNLKLTKKNQEVSGYTRHCPITKSWLYSERCIELVNSYLQKYPEMFDRLARSLNKDVYFESDLWPNEVGLGKVKEVVAWIKTQPHQGAVRRECGSDALEPEEMKALAESLDKQLADLKSKEKKVTLQVKWSLLYKPELHEGYISPDPKADFKMYDRVVCVAKNITVPLGAKGTITAVYTSSGNNTVRLSDKLNAESSYQVMFDEPFPGAFAEDLFEEKRFYRMLPSNMLNISFGRNLRDAITVQKSQPPQTNENTQFSRTPTLLRREHSTYNSAFADYSSKKNTNNQTRAATLLPQNQDNGTQLLRNLLKISQSESQEGNKYKKKADDFTSSSRNKVDSNTSLVNSREFGGRQNNWRMDSNNSYNRMPPPMSYGNEYANRNLKNQSSTSNVNFKSPRGPGPSQVPFPQFENTLLQQRKPNFSYYGNQESQRNRGHGQNYPLSAKNLPQVRDGNVSLEPSGSKQKKPIPSTSSTNITSQQMSSAERLSHPFVPLQVQTSQRRSSNSNGVLIKKKSTNENAPVAPITSGNLLQQNTVPPQPNSSSRPQRKKKPRIAANLPFEMN